MWNWEKKKSSQIFLSKVKEGDVLTILGPNGAGKTVLLKTLLGILPHQGEIEWQKEVKIGYVPVKIAAYKRNPDECWGFSKTERSFKKEIEKTLSLVGFKNSFLNKNIGELSSGQFQRILIAWALIGDPDVLLFDEPTTGIDVGGEETVYALLTRLKKERNLTILLVTHDLSVVFKFSNFVICLKTNAQSARAFQKKFEFGDFEQTLQGRSKIPTNTTNINIMEQFLLSIIAGIFIAGAAGYLGTLMLSNEDGSGGRSLGHLTLPGIALALCTALTFL